MNNTNGQITKHIPIYIYYKSNMKTTNTQTSHFLFTSKTIYSKKQPTKQFKTGLPQYRNLLLTKHGLWSQDLPLN